MKALVAYPETCLVHLQPAFEEEMVFYKTMLQVYKKTPRHSEANHWQSTNHIPSPSPVHTLLVIFWGVRTEKWEEIQLQ